MAELIFEQSFGIQELVTDFVVGQFFKFRVGEGMGLNSYAVFFQIPKLFPSHVVRINAGEGRDNKDSGAQVIFFENGESVGIVIDITVRA